MRARLAIRIVSAPKTRASGYYRQEELSELNRPAIFLDRDGAIIEDSGYIRDPELVRLLPGAAEALAELQSLGYALVVVSNQSGVGRGMLSEAEARAVHQRFDALLREAGIRLDESYYCFDAPSGASDNRKPGIGMLVAARSELGVRFEGSWMVGDKASDMEAGRRAGLGTVLLRLNPTVSDSGAVRPELVDYRAASWKEAVEVIRRASF